MKTRDVIRWGVALVVLLWAGFGFGVWILRFTHSEVGSDGGMASDSMDSGSPLGEIREIGIPTGCIPSIPMGSTTTADHKVILADGAVEALPPVCPFLRGRSLASNGSHRVGSTGQGVWGWDYQAVNPYDAALNTYDAASSILLDGGANYAWFTQVVASWVVLPFPPTAGTTFNSFIGLSTDNNSNGLGHGLNVLQPQVIGNSSTGWSLQLVFCCDEYSAGVTLKNVLPGDTITAEVMLDVRFGTDAGDPSLGRNWIMGANDTGNGGAPDANFRFNYVSVFVPALEGPVDEFDWSAETVSGAATVGGYAGGAGTTSLATFHSIYQYNPADGGNLPIIGPFNPCRTFTSGAAGITRDCFGTDGASGASTQIIWITGYGTPITAGGQFALFGFQPYSSLFWNLLNNCAGGTTGTNCDAGQHTYNMVDGVKTDLWLNW